jgi:lysophospholipid hydrolase
MSLVGFLPPMCEVDKARSDDDHDRVAYLVDGGYLNQLPVDVMKTMGASIVIACDVTGEWSFSGDNFGDSLSGMMAFLRTKLLPFAAASIPSMGDMSQQLAFISSVKQRNQITFEDRDLYIRPAVGSFTIMDFRKSMEIQRHGYEAAIGQLQTWKRAAIEDGWLLCKWPHDEYDDDGELNQHRSKSLSSL